METDFRHEANAHYGRAISGSTQTGIKRRRAMKRSLPFLQSFVDQSTIVSTVNLGIREISLKRVLGTYYEGRSHMFAADFIPLASPNTEFAYKWIDLCSAQLEVGIRDPIIVYEYLNYYYVQEGNKRVSVMKYLDAPAITASVIRLIPSYDDKSLDVRLYYGFLDFYKQTNFEDIWFRKPECFASMIDFMDTTEDKESYLDYLRSYYLPFRRHYKKLERGLSGAEVLTTGDVFLGYCQMFGLEMIDVDSLKLRLGEVVQHILAETVMEVEATVNLSANLLPSLRKLKVAFVFPEDSQVNGWARDHYRSAMKMMETYNNQVTLEVIDNAFLADNPKSFLEEKVAGKHDFAFLIDEKLLPIGEQLAIEYPKTTFLVCSGNHSSYLVPNYFGKVYQANFLLGIYAALVCDLNRIGYVSCDMNEQIYRAMRAFEAGFRSIRPRAVIAYASSEEALPEHIRFSAYYRNVEKSHLTEGTVNTYLKKKGESVYLAYTYWKWEKFYSRIFNHLINGSLKKLQSSQKEAGNCLFFHWGLGTEVIGLKINEALTQKTSELIMDAIGKEVAEGIMEIEPFCDTKDYEEWSRIYRN